MKKIFIIIITILIVIVTGVAGDNYITFLFEREKYYLDSDDYEVTTFPIDTLEFDFICKEDMKHSVDIEGFQSTLTIESCWFNENGMYLDFYFENSVKYRSGSIVALEEFVDDYKIPHFLDIYLLGDYHVQAEPIGPLSPYDEGRLEYRILFTDVQYTNNNQEYSISMQGMIENRFVKK